MKPHPERLERFFESLIPQPERHARWLNTVSMLEATGARKFGRAKARMGSMSKSSGMRSKRVDMPLL